MAEKLIIWISDGVSNDARWLVLDTNGNRAGFPQQGPLEDAAPLAVNRRVIVMLPGEHILAAAARVPGNNPKRILQAAPYALEERLAGDVEALHVALVSRGAEQHCDFLVVERAWLAGRVNDIRAAGIEPDALWPDYLGVPAEPETAHWLVMHERLLGHEGWSGFAAPVDDAEFLFAHRDSDAPLRLTLVGDEQAPAALGDLETAHLEDDARTLTELATGISSLHGPGLLQGAFRQKRDEQVEWRRWQWPAAAAAAWLVLGLASLGIDAWRLQSEQAFLEQATRDLFEQALPGNERMVDPRFQIEQALGNIDTEGSPLLAYIADIAYTMQDIPDARLNGFNFRNDYLEMSVTVPNATTLESLRDALAERAGLPVEVQSANSTQDGLEGRLMIAGESAR